MNDMQKLDAELEKAVGEVLAIPRRPDRVVRGTDLPRERPDKASDQLAASCAALLKVEAELRELCYQLTGEQFPLEEAAEPSKDGPLMPRMRDDSELLVRLAIRLKKLVDEVRSRL